MPPPIDSNELKKQRVNHKTSPCYISVVEGSNGYSGSQAELNLAPSSLFMACFSKAVSIFFI